MLRELVRQVLEPDGHRVLEAASCARAREAFAAADVDLLLADLSLPDGQGTDLAAELLAAHPGLRVLIMTGKADHEIGGDPAWRSHGDAILKPFDVGELGRRVGQLLG